MVLLLESVSSAKKLLAAFDRLRRDVFILHETALSRCDGDEVPRGAGLKARVLYTRTLPRDVERKGSDGITTHAVLLSKTTRICGRRSCRTDESRGTEPVLH